MTLGQTFAPADAASDAERSAPVLEAKGIAKAFAGVAALSDVDFSLLPGEVHALMGENGAGKSTLMKIFAGVHTDYGGSLQVDGVERHFASVRDAEHAGIAIIHQELNLVAELPVADNIFLGREPLIGGLIVDRRRMVKDAAALLRRLGLDIDPRDRVGTLRIGEQQLVEIAKALSLDAHILIMDEPTSALSPAECTTLLKIVRQLARDGVAIVYISHRLEEVLVLADRVSVLRDGKHVITAPAKTLSRDAIIRAMVGRQLVESHRSSAANKAAPLLQVRDLTLDVAGPTGRKRLLHGINFDLQPGEILGIGGLLGSGRSEVLETIFGAADGRSGGEIRIAGRDVAIAGPHDALRHGIAFVSEDRKTRGLQVTASVRDNAALPSVSALARFGWRNFIGEAKLARTIVETLRVRTTGIEQTVANLSGGNQQKIVIGKCLALSPRILLLDEPTRGIDVGAKQELYELIFAQAARGLAIIVVSSEMPELLLLSDRVLVMSEGRQTGLLSRADATQEAIMRLAAPRSGHVEAAA